MMRKPDEALAARTLHPTFDVLRMTDEESNAPLNELAWDLVNQILTETDQLNVEPVASSAPGLVLDFGVEAAGGISAGLALAEVCMASLCDISLAPGQIGSVGWPHLFVQTENPLEACILSQYAGWKLQSGKFFAMGSGPMRAAAATEELFTQFDYSEQAYGVVGVLETDSLPDAELIEQIAAACKVSTSSVALLCAPVTSQAGNLQVIARSVETALHKLLHLGFDLLRVEQACGWAPLAPVAEKTLEGIGRTNDAILHGGRVTVWVSGDDESIREIGPRVTSGASGAKGKRFLDLFEAAGRDFYNMDAQLFSPAQIVFQNVETGRVHVYGEVDETLLRESFGW